jgi:hypothetical protein
LENENKRFVENGIRLNIDFNRKLVYGGLSKIFIFFSFLDDFSYINLRIFIFLGGGDIIIGIGVIIFGSDDIFFKDKREFKFFFSFLFRLFIIIDSILGNNLEDIFFFILEKFIIIFHNVSLEIKV